MVAQRGGVREGGDRPPVEVDRRKGAVDRLRHGEEAARRFRRTGHAAGCAAGRRPRLLRFRMREGKETARFLGHVLEVEGVSKIEPLGQPFEPFECEAVLYEEIPGEEDGQVVKIVRNGYKHHNRVLRAAQVVVSKNQHEQQNEHSKSEEL